MKRLPLKFTLVNQRNCSGYEPLVKVSLVMQIPTLERAMAMLQEGEQRNPGPWVVCTINVAKAAQSIAAFHPDLNPEDAYILGYLHDIGRREGRTGMRHILDGFRFLDSQGFEDAARICLTHSFPIKNIDMVVGTWDCTTNEKGFIATYLEQIDYTIHDRLIQLCDALAVASGYCLIEKRLVDVSLRHGVDEFTIPRWEGYLALQAEFDFAIGKSIYSVLDGVIENTFGFDMPLF